MLTELVELPGGSFRMGSTQFYPEEAPVHTATDRLILLEAQGLTYRHPIGGRGIYSVDLRLPRA